MTVIRKLIRRETYEDCVIEARYMGPDLLAFVDGVDLGGFYLDAQAAIDGGKRFVDAQLKAAREKEANAARAR